MSRFRVVDLAGVVRLREAGATVIDVLPEKEWRESRIPGALHRPLERVDRGGLDDLDRRTPVVVYCDDQQ